MAATRSAHAVWNGDLMAGNGLVSATTSKTFSDLSVSWKARTEEPGGSTSPEELVAAAHAGCFTMKMSFLIVDEGLVAEKLETTCTVKLEDGSVTNSDLVLTASIPGMSDEVFEKIVADATENCPISKLLDVDISVEAILEQ